MRVLFHVAKVLSVFMGFFGAFSLVRSLSSAFNWYAGIVFGNFMNFGLAASWLILIVSLSVLVLSIWHTKRSNTRVLSKIDYSVVLLISVVGFYACFLIIGQIIAPLGDNVVVLYIPIAAYSFAILGFAELVVRIRDKNLLSTLYWLSFFKLYRSRAISYTAAFLLASQLFLIVYFNRLSVILISTAAICLLTYIAAFLLNLSKTYNAANEDKIRAERFKTELITNVSHDIKTPLTSIIGYLDLLKKENLQGKTAEYVHVLDKKSARLKTLIDDLMEASKAGTGNLRVDKQEINLLEIVGQIAGEFEDNFADNGLTLVLRQPTEPMPFVTDSRHLFRILENLFANAAKYALGGTRVFADVTLHNGRPRLTIQNTSAVPVDFSDGEATEQFIRGDKSRHTEGSGLGLHIAKSLAELMGGTLQITVSGDLFRVDVYL